MASGGDVARGEAGAAGCEYEACAGCGCGRDRGADGLDLVGDDSDGGFHAVLREKACGEGAGEVFSSARVAPVGDSDDARGDHVSVGHRRCGVRSGARGSRR